MNFRSHVVRPFDLKLWPNQALVLMVGLAAIAGLAIGLADDLSLAIQAPLHSFLMWALLREIDPDNQLTALVGGAFSGTWVLLGQPVIAGLAVLGLMVAARLAAETTGRRPLTTDVTVVVLGAGFIAQSIEGWVAGFTIGVALFIDDRMSGQSRRFQVWGAAIAAALATVVASVLGVLPSGLFHLSDPIALIGVILGLALVGREPSPPTSEVDSRRGGLLRVDRLHAARAVVGIGASAMVLFPDRASASAVPLLVALALAVVSSEVTRRR